MTSEKNGLRHWRLEECMELDIKGGGSGIARLTLDRAESSANSLSQEVLEELDRLLDSLSGSTARALVICSGKRSGFIAGADIREFTTLKDEAEALQLIRRGQSIFSRIEALPMPTIALIHGFCLGGGLELALACRYRIASNDPSTKLGFPEVKLGIHPGFGGTLRSTRLVGPLAGLELMLTGHAVGARQALKIGLVDYVVPERQLENALAAVVEAPPPPRRLPIQEWLAGLPPARPVVAGYLKRKTARKADPRHYPAPWAMIDLWRGFGSDDSTNYAAEADSIARLITAGCSRNLVRVFLLQERLKALGRSAVKAPRTIHVAGAGVMGGDIAIWCALQGLVVTIQDQDQARLGQVVRRGQALFSRQLRDPRAVQAALDRLIPDLGGKGLARAELVIEAIYEDADAKRDLYRRLEPRMRADAILASNTSSIPLEELATSLAQPERLVGLHFFNPLEKMQLVEVVSMADSDPVAAATASALVLAIKRLPLPVRSSPGFLVNRVLMPYLLEAFTLVEEGVPPHAVDRAATDFGMPMGPLRLADAVGLDICLSVARIMRRHFACDIPPRLEQLVAAGHLGRKSGAGYYDYNHHGGDKATRGKAIPAAEICDRIMLRLLNEAVACHRERLMPDADLLDAGVIFGTGFAPFRGGPLRHISETGAAALHARLLELAQRHGSRFDPDPGWQELIEEQR